MNIDSVKFFIILSMSIALLVLGCAPYPDRSPTTGETQYRDRAPASVTEADRLECANRYTESSRATMGIGNSQVAEGIASMFGLLGAIVNLTMVSGASSTEATYEESMKACLKAKGYIDPE